MKILSDTKPIRGLKKVWDYWVATATVRVSKNLWRNSQFPCLTAQVSKTNLFSEQTSGKKIIKTQDGNPIKLNRC